MLKRLLLFVLMSLCCAHVVAMGCSREDAIQAETEASSLKSWTALHRSYKHYAHCDDGAIGEGYSETVGRLLSSRWDTLPQLSALGRRNGGFQEFVLRHIDETIPAATYSQIGENAKNRCPPELSGLCKKIVGASNLPITPPAPVPFLLGSEPSKLRVSGEALTVILFGRDFKSGARVQLLGNGGVAELLETGFISDERVQLKLSASAYAKAEWLRLILYNPDGSSSNAYRLEVTP